MYTMQKLCILLSGVIFICCRGVDRTTRTYHRCRAASPTGKHFTVNECSAGQVMIIQSADIGFSSRYNPDASPPQCPWLNCTTSTTEPAQLCNGRRTCRILQSIVLHPGGPWCRLQRDGNFIRIQFTCDIVTKPTSTSTTTTTRPASTTSTPTTTTTTTPTHSTTTTTTTTIGRSTSSTSSRYLGLNESVVTNDNNDSYNYNTSAGNVFTTTTSHMTTSLNDVIKSNVNNGQGQNDKQLSPLSTDAVISIAAVLTSILLLSVILLIICCVCLHRRKPKDTSSNATASTTTTTTTTTESQNEADTYDVPADVIGAAAAGVDSDAQLASDSQLNSAPPDDTERLAAYSEATTFNPEDSASPVQESEVGSNAKPATTSSDDCIDNKGAAPTSQSAASETTAVVVGEGGGNTGVPEADKLY